MNALPKEVLDLGEGFLAEVQTLHDINHNWDDNGLSDSGRSWVQQIKRTFIDTSEEIDDLILKAETIPEAPTYIDDIIDGFDMVSK